MLKRSLYVAVLLLAGLLARPLALARPKLRENLRRRRGLWRRFRAALAGRDPSRPLAWFHVASAGELLQAEPVMARLRAEGWQLAVTLTSVSGQRWLHRIADWPELVWADLLPLDVPWHVRRLLAGLRPRVLVYVQADLWPGLVWGAARRGIPQVLIAARIGPGTHYRTRFPLRAVYRDIYGRLASVLAITEQEWARLARLVPDRERVTVGGDPGVETVLQRVRRAREAAPPPALAHREGPVLVAGSTWPADERHLLPVLREALAEFPHLRAVVAPHEPEESALQALEHALGEVAPVARLSALEAGTADARARVVLVDAVGRLAELYGVGTVAYVGGAFGTGVHNVAEPAAHGLPVLFGPRHDKSPVAGALLAAGAATDVHDAAGLRQALWPLLERPEAAASRGEKGRGIIQGLAGAAERCVAAIREAAAGAPH